MAAEITSAGRIGAETSVAVRRGDLFALIASCWTVIAIYYLSYAYTVGMVFYNRPPTLSDLIGCAGYCAVGALLGFAALGPWSCRLPSLKVPVLAGIIVVCTMLMTLVRMALEVFEPTPKSPAVVLATDFHQALIDVSLTIGIAYGLHVVKASRQRLLMESQVERDLAQSKLQLLRVQMQPHFLFNALNGISNAVIADPQEAQRMLGKLGTLLRMSLATTESQMTIVEEEIAFTMSYLELQRARFRERLQMMIEVDDDTRELEIPSFLLQPLVENSVRHALEQTDAAVEIGMRVRRDGTTLRIDVWNSGTGNPPTQRGAGLGLSNTRARLEHLYDGRASLVVTHDAHGTRNALRLPISEPSLLKSSSAL